MVEVEHVKQFIGKKAIVLLKGGYIYTIIVPSFSSKVFTTTDKNGDPITINCDDITSILPSREKGGDT